GGPASRVRRPRGRGGWPGRPARVGGPAPGCTRSAPRPPRGWPASRRPARTAFRAPPPPSPVVCGANRPHASAEPPARGAARRAAVRADEDEPGEVTEPPGPGEADVPAVAAGAARGCRFIAGGLRVDGAAAEPLPMN